MEIIIGIIFVIICIGSISNAINKNKANAYLAKKYDEEKRNK